MKYQNTTSWPSRLRGSLFGPRVSRKHQPAQREKNKDTTSNARFGPGLGPDFVLAPASHYVSDQYKRAVDAVTWLPRRSLINFRHPRGQGPLKINVMWACCEPSENFEYLVDEFFTAISVPYSPKVCSGPDGLYLEWANMERVYRKGRPATLGNRCLGLTEISGSLDDIRIRQHVLAFAEDYDIKAFPVPATRDPAEIKEVPVLKEVEKFFRRTYRMVLPEYVGIANDILSITHIDDELADIIYMEILTTGLPINTLPDNFMGFMLSGSWSMEKKLKYVRKHLGGLTAKEIGFYVDLMKKSSLGLKKTQSAAKKLARAARNHPVPPVVRVSLQEEILKARRRNAPAVAFLRGIEDPYVFYNYHQS